MNFEAPPPHLSPPPPPRVPKSFKTSFIGFLVLEAWQSSWTHDHDHLYRLGSLNLWKLYMKYGFNRPNGLGKIFENDDDR